MTARLKFWGWGLEGSGLAADEVTRLLGFYKGRIGITPGVPAVVPRLEEIELQPPRLVAPHRLEEILTAEPYQRVLHTYGKSYPESVRIFARDFGRAPDLVAQPKSEDDVIAVLDWATDEGAAVIPFGGGSSVVGALELPFPGDNGFAGIISLDLRRLDQVLEVDRTSRAARIQTGILGPALGDALRPHDLALRHFPQSYEFSTLGGWIATRSGGHFATLTTHIDDFVESLRVVTPAGVIETLRVPGSGAGPSPDRVFIGSEGALGVITEAWMRLQARPQHKASAVVAYPSFEAGAEAVRQIAQSGLHPANLRLLDPLEAEINGAGDGKVAILVLGFENADHPIDVWQRRALELAREHGGRVLPTSSAAEAWRAAFLRMPYQREVLVPHALLADTFESAITWERFASFHSHVMHTTRDAIREATGTQGLVSCRFTHVYPDGPAAYYTFHARGRAGALIEQWRHIKNRASDAVFTAGGTITHHHAIGRDHMPWYLRQRPAPFGEALAAAKQALDPAGILNPGVLIPPQPALP